MSHISIAAESHTSMFWYIYTFTMLIQSNQTTSSKNKAQSVNRIQFKVYDLHKTNSPNDSQKLLNTFSELCFYSKLYLYLNFLVSPN